MFDRVRGYDPDEYHAEYVARRHLPRDPADSARLRAMARQLARLRADDEAPLDELYDLESAVSRLPDADRGAVRALLREETAGAMGGVTR